MELGHDEEEGYLGKDKRTFWFYLVMFSWFAFAIAWWFLNFELKMPVSDIFVFDSIGYITAFYLPGVVTIDFFRKNKPLKMKPWFKVLVDYAFVLCFGFAYFFIARNHQDDDSLLIMLVSVMVIATHLHIISVINLLGAYENFGFLDCSLALLVHAAFFLSCKYSEYAPLAVMLVAFALQSMKKSSSSDDQDLQDYYKHNYYV